MPKTEEKHVFEERRKREKIQAKRLSSKHARTTPNAEGHDLTKPKLTKLNSALSQIRSTEESS